MRIPAVVVTLGLTVLLTACAERGTGSGSGGTALPDDADALVLRVSYTGGYVSPTTTVSRLPLVSVYADGRVLSEGPVIEIYPGPAWPNVQVARVDEQTVQQYVAAALEAGVADTADLGTPNIADAATTRFTVVSGGQTYVRDVYALGPGGSADGYTPEQQAARDALSGLVDQLTAPDQQTTAYETTAVAALAGGYVEPDDEFLGGRPPVSWPGPALPGEQVGPDVGCVVAAGEQAVAVTAVARTADQLTPWTDGGATWAVTFRPLLPDETGCGDLVS